MLSLGSGKHASMLSLTCVHERGWIAENATTAASKCPGGQVLCAE
jgi:hypothetical protein